MLDGFNGFAVIEAFQKYVPVDLLNFGDLFRVEATPSQTYCVYAGVCKGFAGCLCKWWNIFAHQRSSGNHHMSSNFHKLVKSARTTDDCPIVNRNMSCYLYCIDK